MHYSCCLQHRWEERGLWNSTSKTRLCLWSPLKNHTQVSWAYRRRQSRVLCPYCTKILSIRNPPCSVRGEPESCGLHTWCEQPLPCFSHATAALLHKKKFLVLIPASRGVWKQGIETRTSISNTGDVGCFAVILVLILFIVSAFQVICSSRAEFSIPSRELWALSLRLGFLMGPLQAFPSSVWIGCLISSILSLDLNVARSSLHRASSL